VRTKLEPPPKLLGPEISPEAKLAQAKNAHAELVRAVRKMRENKRSRFDALAGLVGHPNEDDRARLIWAGLVRFANENFKGKALSVDVALGLRATIALCVHGNERLEEVEGSVYKLEFFEDIYQIQRATKVSTEDAFSIVALELHPKMRGLLAWVADPNRMSPRERRAALEFMLQHGEQELARYDFDPNDEFDDTANVGYPLFYWKRARSFETVMAPIARFVFERLEQYHEGDLPLEAAVPIILCRREGCGNFSVSQRRTKDFCSASCRTRNRQKENAEAHAEYMREYRKNNYTKPVPTRRHKRHK
jgi:hypothetical protein